MAEFPRLVGAGAWSRDESDIAFQNAEGIALFHLVHDLLGGSWFVEGTYD